LAPFRRGRFTVKVTSYRLRVISHFPDPTRLTCSSKGGIDGCLCFSPQRNMFRLSPDERPQNCPCRYGRILSVEQRDDPQLRGKPVIVAWRGNRSVVWAASYEARRCGVRSAMPAARAERLCPDGIFLPPDFVRYRAVSPIVREIFKRHTDLMEPLSLDEAYLDVTENKTGLPTATRVASAIREQIRQVLHLTDSSSSSLATWTHFCRHCLSDVSLV
jgi:hypothetical protein